MENSKVIATAENTIFNSTWEVIEKAPNHGRYLDNMELYYTEARNFELAGGDADDYAKANSFDNLEHMFTSIANQALEDLELRSFDW